MGCVAFYLSTVTPTPHPSGDLYFAHYNTHTRGSGWRGVWQRGGWRRGRRTFGLRWLLLV
jgi:hypothetical protein